MVLGFRGKVVGFKSETQSSKCYNICAKTDRPVQNGQVYESASYNSSKTNMRRLNRVAAHQSNPFDLNLSVCLRLGKSSFFYLKSKVKLKLIHPSLVQNMLFILFFIAKNGRGAHEDLLI